MADRVPAEISIGGKIPATLAELLCQAIAAEGVALDWGEASFVPVSAEELGKACRRQDGVAVLWLCDDQARMGQFESLEQFLEEHGIAFRRRCDAAGEFDPEIVEFHPRLGLLSIPANLSGQPVIALAHVRPVETSLATALDLLERGDRRGVTVVRSAYKLLRKRLPKAFPPLEPFEIEPPT